MTTVQVSPVTAYAEAVVAGKVLTGRLVRLACERHLRDLGRMDIHFDGRAAQFAIDFFSHLSLSGGDFSGKPFNLQPWQAFIVGSLFGWKLPDGLRRFRVGYVEVGKGNGKTPMAAGIGLLMMMADGEERAEVYSAAVDRDQAQILFRDAVAMVDRSPALDSRLVRSGSPGKEWNLAYLQAGSFFRPISSEHTGGRGKSGFRVHCGLLDEVHEHPSAAMVDFMRANAKGRQPLIFEITNSGWDRRSVCYQHHELSTRVLEGSVQNDAWFAYVCSLDPCDKCRGEGKVSPEEGCPDCDDWRDEAVWPKANPNLGISISYRYMRELVAEAVAMPSKRNIVQRLNACMWTQNVTRWITEEMWDANAGIVAGWPPVKGQPCYAALSLQSTYDMSELVLYFPESGAVLGWYWVPRDNIAARVERDQVPYEVWVQDGHVSATDGNVTDFGVIRAKVNELAAIYDIRQVATKRWNATQLQTELQDQDGFKVVQFGDGMKDMSEPTTELEKLLAEGKIQHGGDPVLRWQSGNVAVKTDAEGHMRPDREASQDRFGGIEALIMCIGQDILHDESEAGVMFV